MPKMMRCPYCGLLQDEPQGVKQCSRCGGGLEYERQPPPGKEPSYLQIQMELDQVAAPAGRNVERYLLLTIRTPDKVPPEEAAPAGRERPPLNFAPCWIFPARCRGKRSPRPGKPCARRYAACMPGMFSRW